MEPASGIPLKAKTEIEEALTLALKVVDASVNTRLEKIARIVMNWSAYLLELKDQKGQLSDQIARIGKNQGTVNKTILERIQGILSLVNGDQAVFKCVLLNDANDTISALVFSSEPSSGQREFFKQKLAEIGEGQVKIEDCAVPKSFLLQRDKDYPEEILVKKRFYQFCGLIKNISEQADNWGNNWLVINEDGKPKIEANTKAGNSVFSKRMCAALQLLEASITHWSGFIHTEDELKKSITELIQRIQGKMDLWPETTEEATQARVHFAGIRKVVDDFPDTNPLFIRYLDQKGCLVAYRVYRKDEGGNEVWGYAEKICSSGPFQLTDFSYLEIGSTDAQGVFGVRSNARISRDVAQILMQGSKPSFERLFSEWEFQFRRTTPGVVQYMTLNGIYVELLSHYSATIKPMLSLDVYKESKAKTVDFPEHTYNAFEEIIRILLWKEARRIRWENVEDILSFGNFLQLTEVKNACNEWLTAEIKEPGGKERISERALGLLRNSIDFDNPLFATIVWDGFLKGNIEKAETFDEIKPVLELANMRSERIYHIILKACLNRAKELFFDSLLVLDMLEFVCYQRQKTPSPVYYFTYDDFICKCIQCLETMHLEDSAIERILHFAANTDLRNKLNYDVEGQLTHLHRFAEAKLNELLPEDNLQNFLIALRRRFKIAENGGYEELKKNCEQRVAEYLKKNPGAVSSFKDIPLSSLCLKGTTLKEEDIGMILEAFPFLIALDLSGCTQITGLCLEKVGASLVSLDLSGCKNLVDESIKHLKRLVRLTTLNLPGCESITGSGFEGLVAPIRLLSLEGCTRFQASNLVHLGDLPLEMLNFNSCSSKVNNKTLKEFFTRIARSLKQLHIRSSLALIDAIAVLPNLEFLDMTGCVNVEIGGLPLSLRKIVTGVDVIDDREAVSGFNRLRLEQFVVEAHTNIDLNRLVECLASSQDSLLVLEIKANHAYTTQGIQDLQRRLKKAKISVTLQ